jgi:cap2 methyltransferase
MMAPKKRRKKCQPYHREGQEFLSEESLKFIRDEIDKRFNKKFTLKTKNREFILPESVFLFKEEPFVISELLALKDELNSTKGLLNDMDIEEWHQHTRRTHKAGLVVRHLRENVQAEMCTQAWAKMYEILGSYKVVPQEALEKKEMRSVHLCEAPGAFIASLNHYVRNEFPDLRWEWLASTLNPYYEGNDLNAMLDDDSFIMKTLENWNFGLDGTGDLMKLDNLRHLKQACDGKGSVHLVIDIYTEQVILDL